MKRWIYIFSIFCFVSFSQKTNFKLVLDAGHGGTDPGAMKNGCVEKEIALDVVLRIGAILEKYQDVKIKYTRDSDVFIPLKNRAKIANEYEADLFVSVHCNSSTSPNPYGSMTLVMGLSRSNMQFEIAKTENAVITLEDDYKQNYQGFDPNNPNTQIGLKIIQEESLMQSISFASTIQSHFKNDLKRKDLGMHQQPLWVLDATVMPGVLIELGFLSNAKESKYLKSEEGKNNFAQAIALSILKYKNDLLGTETPLFDLNIQEPVIVESVVESIPVIVTDTLPKENNAQVNDSVKKYKVQIAFSAKKIELIPQNFKGLTDVSMLENANGFKYFYGLTSDEIQAKQLLKEAKLKGYTSAFIVQE